MIKRPTLLPFDQLYESTKPIDKLTLLYVIQEVRKGRKPTITTRYGTNAAITLSYAKLILVTEEKGLAPSVKYVTARGMAFERYILERTTAEDLAKLLPEQLRKKIGRV